MNKTECFSFFGAKMDNSQWSWSGISDDDQTVVIVLWKDIISGSGLTYLDQSPDDAPWLERNGAKARIRHLKHCRDKLEGKFRAVIAVAKDIYADPRSIEKCYPHEKAVWQLDEFDESTGNFKAHVLT